MELLLALGLIAAIVMRQKHGRLGLPQWLSAPAAPPPLWPSAPPAWPAPLPSCASQQWQMPEQRDIPREVTDRAVQILKSSAPMGAQLVEQVAGRIWRFQVEVHGANELNPQPHRGVGVRLCV